MHILNLGVIAASGRMGKAILKLIEEDPGACLAASYGRNSSDDLDDFIRKSSVIIDFSTPQLMSALLDGLNSNPRPLVSGTTAHNNFEKLNELSTKTAVLWAPNMSIGSNLMIGFIESNLSHLSKFETYISEMHHKHKRDPLSGTATLMQDILEKHNPGGKYRRTE
nr:dihydrodipicolinate reductase C-terminal domain-containing protein [Neorickettsia helminthoeca]